MDLLIVRNIQRVFLCFPPNVFKNKLSKFRLRDTNRTTDFDSIDSAMTNRYTML